MGMSAPRTLSTHVMRMLLDQDAKADRDYHAKRVHEPSVCIGGTLCVHWHAWKHGLSASVLFAVDGSCVCAVSVARLLSGEGASSTVYNITRGYYVGMITYVLPTAHAEQGSASQGRSGSIYTCNVRISEDSRTT